MASSGRNISVLLADDHNLVLEGLQAMLHQVVDVTVVGAASDGARAVELYRQRRPDITLLDLRMPVMDGLSALRAIRSYDPAARVILLTTFDSPQNFSRGLAAGARGFLLKDVTRNELIQSIRDLYEGKSCLSPSLAGRLFEGLSQTPLTAREKQVLKPLTEGHSNKEIGLLLGITEGTVQLHVNSIFQKLGARSRTEAARLALRHGLVDSDGLA